MTKIKHIILAVAYILFLSGCATVWDIMDIVSDDQPKPVCDKDSVGATYNDKVCLKYSDNSYRWNKK